MSATDELRRLLDERGVPWKCYGHENNTWWGAWYAENRSSVNGLFLKVEGVVTPEQAIAATLGSCNCSNSERTGTCHNASFRLDESRFHCSECGFGCWVKDVADGRDKLPRYCPNCGRRIVDPTTNDVDAEVTDG